MTTMTTKQEVVIEDLKVAGFYNIKIAEISKYGMYVTFDNGKEGIYTSESFQIAVGKRGSITFISAHRFDTDKKQQRVIASLAGHKLNRKFYVRIN